MPEFRYVAMDIQGRETSGRIVAVSKNEALAKLEAQSLYALALDSEAVMPLTVVAPRKTGSLPTRAASSAHRSATQGSGTAVARGLMDQSIAIGAREVATGRSAGGGKAIARRDVVMFTRQLGDLLRAGLPIDRAILVLEEQAETAAMTEAIGRLREDVHAGRSLSEAMEARGGVFPVIVPRMVRAGEASGQLETVLESVGKYLEGDMARRSQVAVALAYPCLLLVVSVVAVLFITTFLIPRLTSLFDDMGQALPLPTIILLAISSVVIDYWYIIVGLAVGLIVGFISWRRTRSGAYAWDALLLRTPVIGRIVRALCMSRFARLLGTLHAGGVSILEALELVGDAVGNRVYEQALLQVREGVREGEMIGLRLKATGIFTPMTVHMVTVGEESGNLDGLLSRLADMYDFEADNRLKRAMAMLEPSIILIMGVFIAFIIVAVLLPIFDLNASMNVG